MTSRSLRWLYPYTEDPTPGAAERADRTGDISLRPVVLVEMVGSSGSQVFPALVDSGSGYNVVGPWIGRATGALPTPQSPELEIGLGGGTRKVRFVDSLMRLIPPPGSTELPYEWNAKVGILDKWEPPWALLGQVGFFDQFTVTMNRWARGMLIESLEAFDRRVPVVHEEAEARYFSPY